MRVSTTLSDLTTIGDVGGETSRPIKAAPQSPACLYGAGLTRSRRVSRRQGHGSLGSSQPGPERPNGCGTALFSRRWTLERARCGDQRFGALGWPGESPLARCCGVTPRRTALRGVPSTAGRRHTGAHAAELSLSLAPQRLRVAPHARRFASASPACYLGWVTLHEIGTRWIGAMRRTCSRVRTSWGTDGRTSAIRSCRTATSTRSRTCSPGRSTARNRRRPGEGPYDCSLDCPKGRRSRPSTRGPLRTAGFAARGVTPVPLGWASAGRSHARTCHARGLEALRPMRHMRPERSGLRPACR